MDSIEKYFDISLNEKEKENLYKDYISLTKDIEKEFEEKTKLDNLDIKILFLGIFLQIARWYFIDNGTFRFESHSDGDKLFNHKFEDKIKNPRYLEILTGAVPYDAMGYTSRENFYKEYGKGHGLSGKTHRYRTLGHDPILGWIFGPVNILTNTITLNSFPTLESFTVVGNKINIPVSIGTVFQNFVEEISNDIYLLPIALLKQTMHFSSDAFTKLGLPLPVLNNISPESAGKLMESGIDTYSVTRGAILSVIINYVITILHNLYYNEKKYPNKKLYEVKTRKIILLANIISTSSNCIYTNLTKDLKKLDIGGLAITLLRMYKDINFITEIKKEFINTKISNKYEEEIRKLDIEIEKMLKELNYK